MTVEGIEHRSYTLSPGTLDERAVHAFTEGQCHALALVLHERTGWPLRWIEDEEGDPTHCYVLAPDGRGLDIAGSHDRDEFIEAWGAWDEEVSVEEVRALPRGSGGWRIPREDVAARFVDQILALQDRGTELFAPGEGAMPSEGDDPGATVLTVIDRAGRELCLSADELDDEARGFLESEQSYALALALTQHLGGSWRVGVTAADDELRAYAVDEGRGMALNAWGMRSTAELDGLRLMRPRLARELFDEAGYVGPDHGLAKAYAPLIAAQAPLDAAPH